MKLSKVQKDEKSYVFFISLNEKEWEKEQENAIKKISLSLKSPGFRAGKIPLDVAKKIANPIDVSRETINFVFKAIMKYLVVSKEFKENEKELLAMSPKIDVSDNKKIGPNQYFLVSYFKIPSVKIDNYKKIKLSIKEEKIDDKRVNEEIEKNLEKEAMLVPKEKGLVEKNDSVTFDFKGFIDDKPLEGGEAKNYELKIGSNSFIPGFEDQMIGMKVNESKTINVVFPKDYQKKEIANKKAKFDITLHSISTMKKEKLSDEFVKNLKIKDVNNIDLYKKHLKDKLKNEADEKYKNDCYSNISEQILEHAKLSYEPKEFYDIKTKEIMDNTKQELKKYGIEDVNQYFAMMGMDENKFYEQQYKNIKERLTLTIATREIAKLEKITILEKEKKIFIEDYAKKNNLSAEEFAKKIHPEQLEDQIMFDQVINYFINNK